MTQSKATNNTTNIINVMTNDITVTYTASETCDEHITQVNIHYNTNTTNDDNESSVDGDNVT